MTKTTKILLAYAAGQATQLIIHAMVLNNNMYAYRQIPFCCAAGFTILFALITGVFIAQRGAEIEYEEEPKHAAKESKPYIEFVKEHVDVRDGIEEVIPAIYEQDES